MPSQDIVIRTLRFPREMQQELQGVPGVSRVQMVRNARVVFRDTPVMIVATALTGVVGALALVDSQKTLSIGTIEVGVSPFHRGQLDLYVPLVDWGARFEAIKAPARLRIDLRTVDRDTVAKVARG